MVAIPLLSATQVFSAQEVELGASNVMDVVLKEGVLLETAVVTALGIQRDEKALGYAIQRLEGDQIQQVVEPDPLRALQGKGRRGEHYWK